MILVMVSFMGWIVVGEPEGGHLLMYGWYELLQNGIRFNAKVYHVLELLP